VLEVLLKILDFFDVHGKFIYSILQSRGLSLELLGFLLFFYHDRLQFFATVVELTTFIFHDLSFFVHLNNCGFDHIDFVAKNLLRFHFLLGELVLEGGHSTLVAHMVLNYGLSLWIKGKVRPPRTIKLIGTYSQFCLRITPHLRALIQLAHAQTCSQLISRIAPLHIIARRPTVPIFIKLIVFLDNFGFKI
jgi:hypothetical protein